MSTKKIRHHEARQIARAIAAKAFEHLTAPFEAQTQVLARKAYDTMWKHINVDPLVLVKHGFAESRSKTRILVRNRHGAEQDLWLDAGEGSVVAPTGLQHHDTILYDDDLFDAVSEVNVVLGPLTSKRDELMEVLYSQMHEKTVNQAMKNWPEAAEIIAEVLRLGTPAMTVPLEQLLAKFLPALPAPKED